MKKRSLRPLWYMADPVAPAGGGGDAPPAPATPPAAPPAGGDTTPSPWYEQAPADWRDSFLPQFAEDVRPQAKNVLERVPSLPVLVNNYFEQHRKLSKGLPPEDVPWLPKDATPEQLSSFREKIGVPATADKYELHLDAGLTLGDEDRKFFQPLFDVMHAGNVPSSVASQLVSAYLRVDQRAAADVKLKDEHHAQETAAALRRVWGGDYERNIGLTEMFFQDLPDEVRQNVLGGRMADGTALFNSPEFLQFVVGKQREVNPLATVVPQGAGNGMQALETEIKALEARMATPEWYKDEAAQARYRELITARDTLQARK